LFIINADAKLTLGNNVTLKGLGLETSNAFSLITMYGGSLTLQEGSKICDNWKEDSFGSAIFMTATTTAPTQIVMTGGSITNNKVNGYGAVYLETGTFTMSGGSITNNIATDASVVRGGGIYIAGNAVFNMSGGTITGNNNGLGGGVHNRGTFNLSGGSITGNTSDLGVANVYVRKDALATNISGVPATSVALEIDSKITQSDGFSGNVTIDFCGDATQWTGNTVLVKGESYQGAYGDFRLGSFVNTGNGSKTALSGYQIGVDGKLTVN
ncbi:MAG: hypothetical protein LBC40_09690, partial [Dysgonamonadaceae bacterium]|nr:hypothetical protein [Dysgonamonadaceae bacterium]